MRHVAKLDLDVDQRLGRAADRYVLSRVAGARIEADKIIVVNVLTAERAVLPPEASALIVCFMDAITIEDALRFAPDAVAPLEMIDRARSIRTLLSLGVLVPEAEEIGPGPAPKELPAGWSDAAAFIAATRTPEDVAFLNTQEMSELLLLHLASGRQPSAYCELPEAPVTLLPRPSDSLTLSPTLDSAGLVATLLDRRTTRRFAERALPIAVLSDLLRLTWGETARVDNALGDYFLRKTSPSGGALHCVEVYVIVRDVVGVAPGSYHYSVRRHGLELVSARHPDAWLLEAAADQYWVCECPVVFISVPFLPRMAWKYNFSRALRAVMTEAGHLSQTLNLIATALGLGPFTTAALRDAIVERELGLDPVLQPPLILNAVGYLEKDCADRTRPRREGMPS